MEDLKEVDVTLWRGANGTVGIVPWASKAPSRKELTPDGAEVVVYTKFCKSTVSSLLNCPTRDRNEFINDYLP